MKKALKWIIYGIVYILTIPFGWSSYLLYKIFRSIMLFDFCAQSFCLIPGVPGKIIRACFYKQTLKKSYLDLDIGFGSLVSKIETSIGKNVLITGHTTIGLTEIGDRAVIANYVSILSGRYQHNFTDLKDDILTDKDCFAKIIIGPDSFIGEHSTVMANVGSHTIVGAGSVVVKPIPDYVVAVGNPARVVKERRTTTAQS